MGYRSHVHTSVTAISAMESSMYTVFARSDAALRLVAALELSLFCGDVIKITSWAPDVVNLMRPLPHPRTPAPIANFYRGAQ